FRRVTLPPTCRSLGGCVVAGAVTLVMPPLIPVPPIWFFLAVVAVLLTAVDVFLAVVVVPAAPVVDVVDAEVVAVSPAAVVAVDGTEVVGWLAVVEVADGGCWMGRVVVEGDGLSSLLKAPDARRSSATASAMARRPSRISHPPPHRGRRSTGGGGSDVSVR